MKIRKFNESNNYDLSFDGFKDVMSEITDDLNCDFSFYDDESDPCEYYECVITFSKSESDGDITDLDYGFLDEREGGLPFIEDPQSFDIEKIRECLEKIEYENIEILSFKNKIDSQVEKNKYIGEVLKKLSKVKNRFKSFDNFGDYRIGFDSGNGNLSIFYEIKQNIV
jgi:hypothetical protein